MLERLFKEDYRVCGTKKHVFCFRIANKPWRHISSLLVVVMWSWNNEYKSVFIRNSFYGFTEQRYGYIKKFTVNLMVIL